MKTLHRPRRGAAAIEFALCLPIFLALVFSIIDFGWAFFQQANVTAAVREGLREAVVVSKSAAEPPDELAMRRVREHIRLYCGESQATAATISAVYDGNSPEETLTVSAVMPATALIGIIPTPDFVQAEMEMILELQE